MKRLNGFSLMEMMIVLTIVAIVAAASAPMVNKKMVRAASEKSPWVWTAGESIAYNLDNPEGIQDNKTARIGSGSNKPDGVHPRLYITTNTDDTPHIMFGHYNHNAPINKESGWMKLIAGGENNSITFTSNEQTGGINSVVIGSGSSASGNNFATALGFNAHSHADFSTAVGAGANAQGAGSIAIGAAVGNNNNNAPSATGTSAIAIGGVAKALKNFSIAIGNNAHIVQNTNGEGSIMIGNGAHTTQDSTTSIGINAASTGQRAIALGMNASSSGADAISIGSSASSQDNDRTRASGNNSIAIGRVTQSANNDAIVMGTAASSNGARAIALGMNTQASQGDIAIGSSVLPAVRTSATGGSSIAMGVSTSAANTSAIAIGTRAFSEAARAIAIGMHAHADGNSAIAIGATEAERDTDNNDIRTRATAINSVAIGPGASATATNSVAIGPGASATSVNTIVLGDENTTVVIPGTLKPENIELKNLYLTGSLVVDGDVLLARSKNSKIFMRLAKSWDNKWDDGASGIKRIVKQSNEREVRALPKNNENEATLSSNILKLISSDRRLKNVGKEFTSGLDKIKKLEVFNYTFKDDKSKTPRVGVMAQDLQKIFPDAVVKGEDGFLRIRMEDMFYAVVNAIKELDFRTSAQEKKIKELEKQNKELLKRIEKLEKAMK